MTQYTFHLKILKLFEVEGLDQRMEALNDYVRPQLHQLGSYFWKNILLHKQVKHFMLT